MPRTQIIAALQALVGLAWIGYFSAIAPVDTPIFTGLLTLAPGFACLVAGLVTILDNRTE
jgi:hypothetical protein